MPANEREIAAIVALNNRKKSKSDKDLCTGKHEGHTRIVTIPDYRESSAEVRKMLATE